MSTRTIPMSISNMTGGSWAKPMYHLAPREYITAVTFEAIDEFSVRNGLSIDLTNPSLRIVLFKFEDNGSGAALGAAYREISLGTGSPAVLEAGHTVYVRNTKASTVTLTGGVPASSKGKYVGLSIYYRGDNFEMLPSSSMELTATSAITVTLTIESDDVVKAGRYNGSSYDHADPYYYNGTAWVPCEWKRYSGSSWIDIES